MDKDLGVPFLTRKQLTYQEGVTFSLKIQSLAKSIATLTLRVITKEGMSVFKHITIATGAIATDTFRISDIPILVSLTDETGAYNQGACFATVSLMQGSDKLYEMCSGYVYKLKSLSYPSNNGQDMVPGAGRLLSFAGIDQAAGTEIQEVVPTGRLWRLRSIYFSFTTDANVANRRVHLQGTFAGDILFDIYTNIDQAASTTKKYSFTNTANSSLTENGNVIMGNLPDNIWLSSDDTLNTSTLNKQVGDNFGPPIIQVEEFFR